MQKKSQNLQVKTNGIFPYMVEVHLGYDNEWWKEPSVHMEKDGIPAQGSLCSYGLLSTTIEDRDEVKPKGYVCILLLIIIFEIYRIIMIIY